MTAEPVESHAVAGGGSLVALAILVALLYLESRPAAVSRRRTRSGSIARRRCDPSWKPSGAEYLRETGERVEMEFGDSGRFSGRSRFGRTSTSSFPRMIATFDWRRRRDSSRGRFPLCRMQAVLLCRPGNDVASLADLMKPGPRLGIANPDRAAIGKVVREHLLARESGRHSPRGSTFSTST